MPGNINDMKTMTRDMNDQIHLTNNTGTQTLANLRAGSLGLRHNAKDDLLAADNLPGKLKSAVAWMYALEFQLWTPSTDDEDDRQFMFKDAMDELMEFTLQLQQDATTDVSPLSQDPKMWNVYAIAATLHRIGGIQQAAARREHFKPVSALDLVEAGLKRQAQINLGNVSAYSLPLSTEYDGVDTTIGNWPEVAIYLLRVRHNFLNVFAYALSDMSDDGSQPGLVTNFKNLYVDSWLNSKWVPNLAARSTTQLRYYKEMLDLSLETRNFIEKETIEPKTGKPYSAKTDQRVIGAYRRIDWSKFPMNPPKDPATESNAQRERRQALNDLKATIDQLTGDAR
jgi:hypothetical protein